MNQLSTVNFENNGIRELSLGEIEEVGGGNPVLLGIGAAAVTYKTAYETATFYGAGAVGGWLGRTFYDLTHS